MVKDAGSPGILKQIVKSESLKGMESRYERVLQELAQVIKVNVNAATHFWDWEQSYIYNQVLFLLFFCAGWKNKIEGHARTTLDSLNRRIHMC